MARTVTFAAVREAIRQRYDLPSFSDSPATFVSLTAVNAMINASLQTYYGLLIECHGDAYFEAEAQLTMMAYTATADLPARCYAVTALIWQRGTDDVVRLHAVEQDELELVAYSAQSWDTYTPRYRLVGTSSIRWYPTPVDTYTVKCLHSALPADLTGEADTFVAGPGHEDWVVLDVCRKIATREEKPAQTWLTERQDAEARIRTQAPLRGADKNLLMDGDVVDGMSAWGLRDFVTRMF